QPSYIDEVRRLVTTIDNGAGNSSGLYVYNVLNVKASDLAKHLNELFGNNTNGNSESQNGAVAPGFSPLEQTGQGRLGAQSGFGSFAQDSTFGGTDNGSSDMFGGSGSGSDNGMISGSTQSRRQQQGNQGSVAFTTSEGVRIAAVNENNQLLVRATPSAWQKLLPVIQRLDEKPLQVQIETKVLEVNLTGEFQFGVQYYLGGLIGSQPGSPPTPGVDNAYRRHQGAAGLGGVKYATSDALFYSFAGNKLQFALSAMESSGDAKVLSAPSTVVLNNQETTFKVGEKIPIVQTYLVPGIGSTSDSVNAGQVQYIDTGVLLDVVPRVSPGGLVYLDVQQIVSKPSATTDKNGNYTISNRALSTEVAVQSGQTVLLGGLIQQTDSVQDNGVPFLNRIPVLGRLFGTTDRNRDRTELIVLITPRIIRNPEEARQNTDEYESQFESLKPILTGGSASTAPAAATDADASAATPAETLPASAPAPSGDWAVQVASFTSDADAEALHGRLQQLGFASYVESAQVSTGTTWRVRAGPVVSRDAAERLRAVIADSLHLSGLTVVQR
ncbi:MAG TPA: SPOR domain-containing protein, partial [Rhodanobacteraceae bacterium]|nr:SPOR domain-containing protein [Rhodanobacteraceae bacterium]